MKYWIYNNGQRYQAYCSTGKVQLYDRKAKDTTEITLSYNSSTRVLSYQLTNITPRTQHLIDIGYLGVGLFVKEHYRYCAPRTGSYRSKLSRRQHLYRRLCGLSNINASSGTINIPDHALSQTLNCIFDFADKYDDPERLDGYEDVTIGIGRYHSDWYIFRPYKVSDTYIRVTVEN